ncbi:MAG TPA: GIY-YIG nuclease family protein [Kiritimatiellia bacterium]|nr:GIY-YIG nuclease family protein [Kiritimatiellia bacterium]HMO50568.1 GIY-YIG nuclease family protein [Kiritimatiellia bacterium]HMO97550.1 GIY-YIG nuclease family protein [Kiritimatiellia bacterium]HMO97551.1 GIY-YIG nuclease family protein [Kiritimatiellia bacterium]
MAFTYIIYSQSHNKTYVGCAEDWRARLNKHNAGKVKATSSGLPWSLVLTEEHSSMLDARRRERYLKSSAGRRWMKKTMGDLSEGTPARPATGRDLVPV